MPACVNAPARCGPSSASASGFEFERMCDLSAELLFEDCFSRLDPLPVPAPLLLTLGVSELRVTEAPTPAALGLEEPLLLEGSGGPDPDPERGRLDVALEREDPDAEAALFGLFRVGVGALLTSLPKFLP